MTTALLGFALASTLVILAPGPDLMLVMRNTMRGGRRAGWLTACGTLSGLAIWAFAAALGLSTLLQVSLDGARHRRRADRVRAAAGRRVPPVRLTPAPAPAIRRSPG